MKIAVVMKVRMTLPLPLISLLMISGESQMFQHHFKMFSEIAHIKYPLYYSPAFYPIRNALCVFMSVDIGLTSLEGVAKERGAQIEIRRNCMMNYLIILTYLLSS